MKDKHSQELIENLAAAIENMIDAKILIANGSDGPGGRHDILLEFKKKNKINISKLAIWRIKFGDCSWLSDYLVNYQGHFNS